MPPFLLGIVYAARTSTSLQRSVSGGSIWTEGRRKLPQEQTRVNIALTGVPPHLSASLHLCLLPAEQQPDREPGEEEACPDEQWHEQTKPEGTRKLVGGSQRKRQKEKQYHKETGETWERS